MLSPSLGVDLRKRFSGQKKKNVEELFCFLFMGKWDNPQDLVTAVLVVLREKQNVKKYEFEDWFGR